MTSRWRGRLFLGSVAALTVAGSIAIAVALKLPRSHPLISLFWISGFVLLTLNLSYFLVSAFIWGVLNDAGLPEVPLTTLPPTAILYVVRNEREAVVLENLRHSLENNLVDHVDLWLLSNSDLDEYVAAEATVIATLKGLFGDRRVQYFRAARNPLRRKHVCVHEWLAEHLEYTYVVVCDADSRLPRGSVERLVAKAEHPDNADVVLFQSHISVHGPTYFATLLGLIQEICQELYARVNQGMFDRGVSYGSGHLIRAKELGQIEVPAWVLSHDIWDTVSLEQQGHRVVFCGDIKTQGSFPLNYLEYLSRSRRWILGTLESVGFCARSRIPLGTRFMTLYPAYMYLSQPLFVLWLAGSVFCDARVWNSLFAAQQYAVFGASAVDLEMGSHLVITLALVLGPRAVRCRSLADAAKVLTEAATSSLLCLNSIVFDSAAVLEFFVVKKKGRDWVAMRKGDAERVLLISVVKKLWPAALLGCVGVGMGLLYSRRWTLVAAPFLGSFLLSIPLAYWTGNVEDAERANEA